MRTRSWFRHLSPLLFVLLCAEAVFAGAGAPPENWEARARMVDAIFAPIHDAASRGRQLITQSDGSARVSFRPDVQSGALYLIFANQARGGYPLDSAGTFIIKRSLRDGSFLQAKVFVQDGPGSYLRLFPQGDRTLMDVVLFGEPFQTGVALPVAFDSLLTSPLSHIMDWTSASVDWSLVLAPPVSQGDRAIAGMVKTLRARLPGLRDMDDGAMDGDGRMVFIATGAPAGRGGFNCSGFAKWVVDGLYAPLAGRDMDIGPLKSRNALRDNTWSTRFEEELDPFFGLDWSRGLARLMVKARAGSVPSDEAIDVTDDDRVLYVRDVGYPVPKLEYLLYFLARRDPGTLYIGSVNAPSALASSEGTPTLRQHHHVIVLLPYFDEGGAFHVVVMERNKETSLASLYRRYGGEHVHLVRVDALGDFSPPRIE